MSFLNFLNPFSSNSGLKTKKVDIETGPFVIESELQDNLVFEEISTSLHKPFTFWQSIKKVFDLFVGTHYHLAKGSKGLLDFLIFPLVSRKLNAYFREYQYGWSNLSFLAICLSSISLPFEAMRFVAGFLLTFALTPLIAIGHFFKRERTTRLKEEVLSLIVSEVVFNPISNVNPINDMKFNPILINKLSPPMRLEDLLDIKHGSIDELVEAKEEGNRLGGKFFRLHDRETGQDVGAFTLDNNEENIIGLNAFNAF